MLEGVVDDFEGRRDVLGETQIKASHPQCKSLAAIPLTQLHPPTHLNVVRPLHHPNMLWLLIPLRTIAPTAIPVDCAFITVDVDGGVCDSSKQLIAALGLHKEHQWSIFSCSHTIMESVMRQIHASPTWFEGINQLTVTAMLPRYQQM